MTFWKLFFVILVSSFTFTSAQDWLQNSGKADLLDYLQVNSLPTAISEDVPLTMVESGYGVKNSYFPVSEELGLENFGGVTFTDRSNLSEGFSDHANVVGSYFFSRQNSFLSGVSEVECFEANDFITQALALSGGRVTPLAGRVASHAWIGNHPEPVVGESPEESEEIVANFSEFIHRFDFLGSAGNTLMVVGLNNEASTAVPSLWAHSYNALSVGIVDGNHSSGGSTSIYENYDISSGRSKPDLVASSHATSFATGQVASGAGYVYGLAQDLGFSEVTEHTELQRAILMAGASKERFPTWTNSSSSSLDQTWGAGELNVFNAHRITESDSSSNDLGYYGWKFLDSNDSELTYKISIPEGVSSAKLSMALCWNREIEEVYEEGYQYFPKKLKDYSLSLHGETVIQESDSLVDNVEYLYFTDLETGHYTLTVRDKNPSEGGIKAGLAWRINFDEEADPVLDIKEDEVYLSELVAGLRYEIWESEDNISWEFQEYFTPDNDEWSIERELGKVYQVRYWP